MEVHWRAVVSAHADYRTSLDPLLDGFLAIQHLTVGGLEVRQAVEALEGIGNFCPHVGREIGLEFRIIQTFGEIDRIRINPDAVGGGGHYGAATVRYGMHQVRTVGGVAAGTDVLQNIYTCFQRVARGLFFVKMGMNRNAFWVGHIDYCLELLIAEAALGFDEIDSAGDVGFGCFGGFRGALNLDLHFGREDRVFVDDPGAAHQHARARNLILIDAVANADTFLQWRAQINGSGDAGHQQLFGREVHDLFHRPLRFMGFEPFEPAVVIAMADDDQMGVEFDHAGHHGLTAGIDDRGSGGNPDVFSPACLHNAIAFHKNGGVMNRGNLIAIQQHAAGEGDAAGCLCVEGNSDQAGDKDAESHSEKASRVGSGPSPPTAITTYCLLPII